MDKRKNMRQFLDFQKMIAEAETKDFYKDSLGLAQNVIQEYWKAYRNVLEEVYKKQKEILREDLSYLKEYDINPVYDIKDIIKKSCDEKIPLEKFVKELVSGIYLADVIDIELYKYNLHYSSKDNVFFSSYTDFDSSSFDDPPSYYVQLTPDEVLEASEDGNIKKHVDTFAKNLNAQILHYLEKVECAKSIAEERKSADYQLYTRLKKQFEPER